MKSGNHVAFEFTAKGPTNSTAKCDFYGVYKFLFCWFFDTLIESNINSRKYWTQIFGQ